MNRHQDARDRSALPSDSRNPKLLQPKKGDNYVADEENNKHGHGPWRGGAFRWVRSRSSIEPEGMGLSPDGKRMTYQHIRKRANMALLIDTQTRGDRGNCAGRRPSAFSPSSTPTRLRVFGFSSEIGGTVGGSSSGLKYAVKEEVAFESGLRKEAIQPVGSASRGTARLPSWRSAPPIVLL